MNQWVGTARSVRRTLLGLANSTRVLTRRLGPVRWRSADGERLRLLDGFRDAERDQKVALLGLVLVLAILSWP